MSRDLSRHVTRLLPAYVHGQLTAYQRRRVALHLAQCGACRAALNADQQIVADLRSFMPRVGLPRVGQITRLFPYVWQRFSQPASHAAFPSYGLGIIAVVLCAFVISAFTNAPAQALSGPLQQIAPTQATTTQPTLVASRTEPPLFGALLEASETARPNLAPMASPAPQKVSFTSRTP